MFGLGTPEIVIIGVVVLLLFGSRLPSVMRSLGSGVVEFKKGLQGIEDDAKSSSSTSKKEEQSSKPSVKDEAEHGHSDAAPR